MRLYGIESHASMDMAGDPVLRQQQRHGLDIGQARYV